MTQTTTIDNELDFLLRAGSTPHATSLEDYVAYKWKHEADLLGRHHGAKRNRVALGWLSEAVQSANSKASILDVGCSYGDHLFMLNAMLGKPNSMRMIGVDLYRDAVGRANAFARRVPGFYNCEFHVADLSRGLPFRDGEFSAVNCCDVLEHMDEPIKSLRELRRVLSPRGVLVISTPLKDSVFKRIAALANRVTNGVIYKEYYSGKDTVLGDEGEPVMRTTAGNDHVSEMNLHELKHVCSSAGFEIEEVQLMSIMSGSRWFDQHPFWLSALLLAEAIHNWLQFPSWAHSVMLKLRSSNAS